MNNVAGKSKGEKWMTIGLAAGSVIFGLILLRFCFDLLMGDSGQVVSARSYQLVRLVIGLAAGFIAAGLVGPFEIEAQAEKGWLTATVKAGGPTGIAIFFYLVNPLGIDIAI